MNNKLNWRSVLYLLLLAVAATLIVVWWPELTELWREHLITFIWVVLLMSIGTLVQARNFITFLSKANSVGFLPITHAWAIGSLLNYLGPFQPGLAARIAIMAKQGITVTDIAIATLRQTFAMLWMTLPIAALCLIWIDFEKLMIPALVLLAVFILVPSMFPIIRIIAQRILSWTALRTYSSNIGLAIRLPSLNSSFGILIQYTVSAATFYYGYSQFGIPITFAEAFGLACVIYSTSLFAVLPGNFGVLEMLCAGFGKANGMPLEDALALAFLYRGASIASSIVLVGVTGFNKRTNI